MKFSWKNIENWQSWEISFFWGGHFEFSKSAILNFFLLHLCEKSSPFIWGIIFFCTMNGFFRILKKTSFQFFCTRLYNNNNNYNNQQLETTTLCLKTDNLCDIITAANSNFIKIVSTIIISSKVIKLTYSNVILINSNLV